MRTRICELLGIEFPVLAFTHCRDVAIEVSRSGGLGVLGGARKTPDEFDMELTKMDEALGGTPYGVDVLIPARHEVTANESCGKDGWAAHITELEAQIPAPYREFRERLAEQFGVKPPKDWANRPVFAEGAAATPEDSLELLEVAFAHPMTFIMSALGPAPREVVERAHDAGVLVGGLVGSGRHAEKHRDVGADVVAAIGTEAAGHTGDISTMVLVPEVVDAVAPMPVLAGGGIGRGRQLAAVLCLGAVGAWTGSVWLTTKESDLDEKAKQMLLSGRSQDSRMTRYLSGKTTRIFMTKWFEAWEESGLEPLGMPYQGLLQRPVLVGAKEQQVDDIYYSPVGQIVGAMNTNRSTRDVMYAIIEELVETLARVGELQRIVDGEA